MDQFSQHQGRVVNHGQAVVPFKMLVTTLCFSLMVWVMMGVGSVQAQSALKGHDTQQPIDVSSDDLELRPNDGWALLTGLVKVTQGGLQMTADKMRVFYDQESLQENPVILRLDAMGKIKFVSSSETVTADRAIYDVETRLVTMVGNVQIVRGSSRLQGARLELDLVSGITKLDGEVGLKNKGRVKGVFSLPKKEKSKQN